MSIAKWGQRHQANELARLSDTLARFFKEAASPDEGFPFAGKWNPHVDIAEEEGAFLVKAELPGLDKDDIEIEIRENVLTVKGEKKEEKEEKGKTFHRVERRYGSFSRSFYLPDSAVTDDLKASYKNGILELKIPKKEEVKPKKVEVGVD